MGTGTHQRHSFSDEALEDGLIALRAPDAADVVRLRATYFPLRQAVARRLHWRRHTSQALPPWEALHLLPLRMSRSIQTVVVELPFAGFGLVAGELFDLSLLHVGYADPLSILLRLDVEFGIRSEIVKDTFTQECR